MGTLYSLYVYPQVEIAHRFAGTDRKVPAQMNILTSENLRATCQQNPPVMITEITYIELRIRIFIVCLIRMHE